MYDNGLIGLYQHLDSRDGFLNVKSLRLREVSTPRLLSNTVRCKSTHGYFFKKFNSYFSKEMADAEIFLSQLSTKMGLTSAIYTPAQEDGKLFLLSNDIWKPNNIPSQAFHEYICLREDIPLEENIFKNLRSEDIVKYFTDRAIQQKIKAQVFDVASNNPDRNLNYFYSINNQLQADDMVLLDFERSGIEANCYYLGGRNQYCSTMFANDFSTKNVSRNDIIEAFRTSERLNEIVDKHEIAESLGSIDADGVALDITRSIGYVVEPKYVEYIKSSFNNMAEALEK